MLTLRDWNDLQDPTGMWVVPQRDGIRAYWNGRSLLSSRGRDLKAPKSFILHFPEDPLIGELFIDNNTSLQVATQVAQKKPSFWNNARYFVYDVPNMQLPYEQRLQYLKGLSKRSTELIIPEPIQCKDASHLESIANTQDKPNGVILISSSLGIFRKKVGIYQHYTEMSLVFGRVNSHFPSVPS
jgi:hypothetical protein